MISTSRGLSAVRPAGDRDQGPGPWRGGLRPGGGILAGDSALDDSALDDGALDNSALNDSALNDASILADAGLLAGEHVREIQLPEVADAGVEGSASTASTSALAV
jgi:hypothetical protein